MCFTTWISLVQEFNTFFHAYFNKTVSCSDRLEFVNGWYILIIVSDALTIAGSVLKIGIQTKVCLSLSFTGSIIPCWAAGLICRAWYIKMNHSSVSSLISSHSTWQTMMSAVSCLELPRCSCGSAWFVTLVSSISTTWELYTAPSSASAKIIKSGKYITSKRFLF